MDQYTDSIGGEKLNLYMKQRQNKTWTKYDTIMHKLHMSYVCMYVYQTYNVCNLCIIVSYFVHVLFCLCFMYKFNFPPPMDQYMGEEN